MIVTNEIFSEAARISREKQKPYQEISRERSTRNLQFFQIRWWKWSMVFLCITNRSWRPLILKKYINKRGLSDEKFMEQF